MKDWWTEELSQIEESTRDLYTKGWAGLGPGRQLSPHFLVWKDTTGTIDEIWIKA